MYKAYAANTSDHELEEDIYLQEFLKNTITKCSNFGCSSLGLHSNIGPTAEVERKLSENKEICNWKEQNN